MIKIIEELEDNWDGYGAVPPSSKVIENAKTFISILGQDGDIYPTPYGSICIDLDKVSIEIGEHMIGWFELNGPEYLLGIETDFKTIPEELRNLI